MHRVGCLIWSNKPGQLLRGYVWPTAVHQHSSQYTNRSVFNRPYLGLKGCNHWCYLNTKAMSGEVCGVIILDWGVTVCQQHWKRAFHRSRRIRCCFRHCGWSLRTKRKYKWLLTKQLHKCTDAFTYICMFINAQTYTVVGPSIWSARTYSLRHKHSLLLAYFMLALLKGGAI